MKSQSFISKRFKLGQVIVLSFSTIVVTMIGVGASSTLAMRRMVNTSELVKHTFRVEANILQLEKVLVDAETGQRGFLLTGNRQFLTPYNNSLASIEYTIRELDQLIQDNPEQVERLDQLHELTGRKINELSRAIELKQAQEEERLTQFLLTGDGRRLMEEMRALVQEMLAVEEQLLQERSDAATQAARVADLISLGGTLLVIGICLFALGGITRHVIAPIHRVANTLASSSSNLAGAVQDQEASAQEQAVAVQQTTTTMDELKASSHQSSEQADVSAMAARQVMTLANTGTQVVEHTLSDMESIRHKVDAIVAQIAHLQDQAQQIAGITDVVGNLANQTNMLALNAAVEAVRAGDHGRGFSVVASEIRKLADQSKGSADKIKDLLASIQTAVAKTVATASDGRETVEQGSKMVKDTAATFMEVTDAIGHVVTSSDQISLNARQQVAAIQQVVDAMTTLNHEAVRNASGISQARASAEDLNQAVQQLQAVV